MSRYPKISIVTPSYNQGNFLEQTILSVLNQNYPNLEFIIIDGASSDQSVEIIRKYDSRISYWVSEPDNGQTHAINKGFEKATGDIFTWLNADDFYEADCLFEIAEKFMSGNGIACVCGREKRIDETGAVINFSEGTEFSSDKALSLFKAHIDQPSSFFRKSEISSYFPLPMDLKYTMDAYLWTKFMLNHEYDSVYFSSSVWVNFRYHRLSKTILHSANFLTEKEQFQKRLIAEIQSGRFIEFANSTDKEILNKFVAIFLKEQSENSADPSLRFRKLAGSFAILNRKRDARMAAWNAIRKKPFKWLNWKVFLKTLLLR